MLLAVTPGLVRHWMESADPGFASISDGQKAKEVDVFKRHYALSTRRISGVTQLTPPDWEDRVARFHQILFSLFTTHKPSVVVVGDETFVLQSPKSNVTLEARGAKRVPIRLVGGEKDGCTVWLCHGVESVEGNTKPVTFRPLVIFKGKPGKLVQTQLEQKKN